MKKTKLICTLTLFSLFFNTVAYAELKQDIDFSQEVKNRPKSPTIKVQLFSEIEGAQVEVKGPHNVYDPNTGNKLASNFASSKYYAFPTNDGIKWGQEFPGVYQLLIVPDLKDGVVLVQGTEYPGMVYLYQFEGKLGIVNEVSFEDFVASILSHPDLEGVKDQEMLASLAIVMRTQTLDWKANSQNKYWDIKAPFCQYQGRSYVRFDEPFLYAIKTTKDMVLAKSDNDSVTLGNIPWFSKEKGFSYDKFQVFLDITKEKSDAKSILREVFPRNQICLIKQLQQESSKNA